MLRLCPPASLAHAGVGVPAAGMVRTPLTVLAAAVESAGGDAPNLVHFLGGIVPGRGERYRSGLAGGGQRTWEGFGRLLVYLPDQLLDGVNRGQAVPGNGCRDLHQEQGQGDSDQGSDPDVAVHGSPYIFRIMYYIIDKHPLLWKNGDIHRISGKACGQLRQ